MFLSYLSHFWDILICIYMALRQGLSLGESSYYGQYIWCRGVLRQGGADLTWSLAPKHCSGPRHIYAQLTKPLLAKQELCLWTLLDQVWLHLCMKDVRFVVYNGALLTDIIDCLNQGRLERLEGCKSSQRDRGRSRVQLHTSVICPPEPDWTAAAPAVHNQGN